MRQDVLALWDLRGCISLPFPATDSSHIFLSGHGLDVGLPHCWLLWHPWVGAFIPGGDCLGWPSVPKRKYMRRGCEWHKQGWGTGFFWAGKPQGVGDHGKVREGVEGEGG